MFTYPAKLVRVVDGDTFELNLDIGFYLHKFVKLRLLGVDTHEMHGKNSDLGQTEKEFVQEWFKLGEEEWDGQFPFLIHTEKQGSFGRWLGTVKRRKDGAMLSDDLLDEFEGIEYSN